MKIKFQVLGEGEDVGELSEHQVHVAESPGCETRQPRLASEGRKVRDQEDAGTLIDLLIYGSHREPNRARVAEKRDTCLCVCAYAREAKRRRVRISEGKGLDRF